MWFCIQGSEYYSTHYQLLGLTTGTCFWTNYSIVWWTKQGHWCLCFGPVLAPAITFFLLGPMPMPRSRRPKRKIWTQWYFPKFVCLLLLFLILWAFFLKKKPYYWPFACILCFLILYFYGMCVYVSHAFFLLFLNYSCLICMFIS